MDQQHFQQNPNDSDDEPEEISKAVSESRAKETFKNEKLAKNIAQEKLKEKRRQILKRDTEQKLNKQQHIDIERLPNDLLDDLDFTVKGKDQQEVNFDQKKRKIKKKQKEKVKREKLLETASTHYKILSMDEVLKSNVPISQTTAVNFREQMLYNKRRNKRILNRQALSNRLKRQSYRK